MERRRIRAKLNLISVHTITAATTGHISTGLTGCTAGVESRTARTTGTLSQHHPPTRSKVTAPAVWTPPRVSELAVVGSTLLHKLLFSPPTFVLNFDWQKNPPPPPPHPPHINIT